MSGQTIAVAMISVFIQAFRNCLEPTAALEHTPREVIVIGAVKPEFLVHSPDRKCLSDVPAHQVLNRCVNEIGALQLCRCSEYRCHGLAMLVDDAPRCIIEVRGILG